MKWSTEQLAELKAMCMNEVSNADMAAHFCVPVTEIHAQRSHLGITIPKIKAAKGKAPLTVNPEFETAVVSMDAALTSVKIDFRLRGATKTCYRFESGQRPDFNTLYIKKSQIDRAGINPSEGITITVEQAK